MPKAPTYRDLPVTAARTQKHLEFAASYLEQARLDLANGGEGFAEAAMVKRRQHQQSLADIRAARSTPKPRTVQLVPTWRGVMPLLIAAVRDGTDVGRRLAEEELYRLAGIADGAVRS